MRGGHYTAYVKVRAPQRKTEQQHKNLSGQGPALLSSFKTFYLLFSFCVFVSLVSVLAIKPWLPCNLKDVLHKEQVEWKFFVYFGAIFFSFPLSFSFYIVSRFAEKLKNSWKPQGRSFPCCFQNNVKKLCLTIGAFSWRWHTGLTSLQWMLTDWWIEQFLILRPCDISIKWKFVFLNISSSCYSCSM